MEHENDPVWCVVDRRKGWVHSEQCSVEDARNLADGMPRPEHYMIARWDAEALTWIVAPPAPAEVTGVPSRYVVRDKYGDECEGHATLDQALACAATYDDQYPTDTPHRVEACIPVPRNEAHDG